MNSWILVTLLIGFIAVIIGVIVLFAIKKQNKEGNVVETDYRVFFILGISFLPLGIVMTFVVNNPGFIGFLGAGACFLAIGLANRDKWKTR